jgi:hypothetical protein
VFGGLNRLLAAAVVAGAVLVVPPAAFADCGGNPSAVNVYKECVSTGGGGKATGGGSGPTSGTSGGSTSGGSTDSSVPMSKQTQQTIKKAGADGQSLANLVKAHGGARLLQSSNAGATTEPTAVGSAFDLGAGPTALLIVLATTAFLLLATTGYRGVRQRRR